MRKDILRFSVITILIFALTVATIAGCGSQNSGVSSQETSSEVSSEASSEASSEVSSEPSSEPSSSAVSSVVSGVDPSNPYYDLIMSVEGLDNTRHGYGFGLPVDANNRPIYAQDQQNEFGKHGMTAITDDLDTIYLTFDEGYEYGNNTSKILDVLKEKNCTATFFVTIHYVEAHPDLVRRMIDEGHVVGNHTAYHPDMTTITSDRAVREIMVLHNYVLEHFGYEMKTFRPPTGAYSVKSLEIAKRLGYQTVEWSFAYEDWDTGKQPEKEYAYNYITDRTHGGAIYLLHAVSTTNAEILGDVIDYWRGEGYTVTAFPNEGPSEN